MATTQTITITLPRLHDGQQRIKRERGRYNCVVAGRRFGKNVLLHDLCVESALARSQPTAWAAPTYRQLMDDWRTLSDLLQPVTTRRNETEKQIALLGGGILDFWSLDNPDTIRGRKYARFIVNEAGLVARLADIWNLIARPTLIDLEGDAYFAGTPKGRNDFWQLYNITQPGWVRWQFSSYDNPHIPAAELNSLQHTMTERAYAQEILAQFIEDGGGVFRYVMDAATATPQAEAAQDHQYLIGVDWGRVNDATVFAVMDSTERALVYLDRMTGTDYGMQRNRLVALWERFGKCPVVAEYNSMGGPQVEALQAAGMGVRAFNTTNASKAEIIQGLELAFERHDITILPDDILINELLAYESERLSSGMVRYGAPSGGNDDTVMALAIAWNQVAAPAWLMSHGDDDE